MSLVSGVRAPLVEVVLAAAAVAAIEGARAVFVGGSSPGAVRALAAWSVVSALAWVGGVVIAVALAAMGALMSRARVVAAWTRDLAAGGATRTVAVWRAWLVVVAVMAFAVVCWFLAAWMHETFRFDDAGIVGLIVVAAMTPLAGAVVFAALEVDRWAAGRLEAAAWAATAFAGLRIWGAALAAAVVIITSATLGVHVASPASRLAPAITGSCLVAIVGLSRAAHIGRRRAAQIAAVAVIVACAGALTAIPAADKARGLVVVHGLLGRPVLLALWGAADRDGDGYPSRVVGGPDCDDSDRGRSPSAVEIAGNGVDENCTGADADVASIAASREPRPAPRPGTARNNIVLISIDSLRADHLGAWGYSRPISPVLDALAARGTRFSWAFTSSPFTRHAVASMLTGRYPSAFGRRAPRRAWRQENVPTLAQTLGDAGWDTAAITCCGRFSEAKRERIGFVTIDVSADATRLTRAGKGNGDVIADKALAWLRRRSGQAAPFFLWMHFIDPHYPYATPEGESELGDSDADRYDAEIAFADRQIGRVLAGIDEIGLTPKTTVVVTADHGEEFNEHGIRFHGRSLFNQVVRIPLIVFHPGSSANVVDTPVSIVDIMPTLLELVEIPAPQGMNGYSLAAAVRGKGDARARPVLLEQIPNRQVSRDLVGLVSGGWKVVWDREANTWSLFGLHDDPRDVVDRSRLEPQILGLMQQALREALDRELAR